MNILPKLIFSISNFLTIRSRRFWIILSLIFLVILLCTGAVFLYISQSTPLNIAISNISDQQVTISWTTEKPVVGELMIRKSEKEFPIVALGNIFSRDVRNRTAKTLHYQNQKDLKPNNSYYFRIYHNGIQVYQGRFIAAPTLKSMTAPYPVYGTILSPDKKTPLAGVIVFLKLRTPKESTPSAILSAQTNFEGRWTIDLANARTLNLKNTYALHNKIIEEVIVEAGKYGRVKSATSINKDQPWPNLILLPLFKK